VTPASGTGTTVIQVSVNAAGLTAGTYTGTITVSDPNASNTPQTITITLTVYNAGGSTAPSGYFDSPEEGTQNVSGAIPVTGWVADDIETTKVEIWRDNIEGETPAGLWFIGTAIFVEGARTDIEQIYTDKPLNYKAGWGYLMLTNMLPGQGNGPFKLYAYATDKEGNTVLLGTKSITCDNAHATKPFGTIDTPAQGGDASGSLYVNFGWVLTPTPKTVPKDGSTITVWVDGTQLGDLSTWPNVYNQYRKDIADNFPGLNNTDGAVGGFYLDTTKYTNGVHSIYWVATDNEGQTDGIGSRFFNIVNTGSTTKAAGYTYRQESLSSRGAERRGDLIDQPRRYVAKDDVLNLPVSFAPLLIKRGFDLAAPPEIIRPDNYGVYHIDIKEIELLRISLDPDLSDFDNPPTPPFRKGGEEARFAGYVVVGDQLRPLPIGSTLDPRSGVFSWAPGPGFIGSYDLIFVRESAFGIVTRFPVKVMIRPKF